MRSRLIVFLRLILALLVLADVGATASAAEVTAWGASLCTSGCVWSVDIGNDQVLSGTYIVDPLDGSLHVNPSDLLTAVGPDGSSVSINGLTGNIDPILGINVGAGTGALGKTFTFNFSMPVSLSGSITANSSTSYSLTSLTGAGAQVAPLFGHVVTAQEVDTSVGGLPALNKGVDVGDTFFFTGGPATHNSPVYTAVNVFTGNAAYDLMSITVSFSLSADSQVGISGFVQQEPTVVPLPAALPLLLSGLGVFGFARKRGRRATWV